MEIREGGTVLCTKLSIPNRGRLHRFLSYEMGALDVGGMRCCCAWGVHLECLHIWRWVWEARAGVVSPLLLTMGRDWSAVGILLSWCIPNISDAPDEEMYIAAKRANIHDLIMSLPLQYDTNVGAKVMLRCVLRMSIGLHDGMVLGVQSAGECRGRVRGPREGGRVAGLCRGLGSKCTTMLCRTTLHL